MFVLSIQGLSRSQLAKICLPNWCILRKMPQIILKTWYLVSRILKGGWRVQWIGAQVWSPAPHNPPSNARRSPSAQMSVAPNHKLNEQNLMNKIPEIFLLWKIIEDSRLRFLSFLHPSRVTLTFLRPSLRIVGCPMHPHKSTEITGLSKREEIRAVFCFSGTVTEKLSFWQWHSEFPDISDLPGTGCYVATNTMDGRVEAFVGKEVPLRTIKAQPSQNEWQRNMFCKFIPRENNVTKISDCPCVVALSSLWGDR